MPTYNGLFNNSMHFNGDEVAQSMTNKMLQSQAPKGLNNTAGLVKGSKRNFKSGLTMSNDKQIMAL